MKKYKLVQKAWRINLELVDEGYMYSEMSCLAETKNKAKSILLANYRDEFSLRFSDDVVSYLNIPVERYKDADRYEFEGEEKTIWEIGKILEDRERIWLLDSFLEDKSATHCYIVKGGYYYRPNFSRYTEFRHRAGVYTIEEGVRSAKSCGDISLIPIVREEHNKLITDEINDLKTRLL